MRRPCLFKERDVKRVARAVLATGLSIERVEIDREGKIAIIAGKAGETACGEANEWDEVNG